MHKSFLFIVLYSFFTLACSSDVAEPAEACENLVATYNDNVKEIIDLTCAYTGCHVNGGNGPGNYSTFEGLRPFTDNGSFAIRVIDEADNTTRGMPPNMSSYPESRQDDLSAEQMEIIMCWIAAGYPEG